MQPKSPQRFRQRLRANEKARKEPAVSSARLSVGEDIPKKTYKFLLSGQLGTSINEIFIMNKILFVHIHI